MKRASAVLITFALFATTSVADDAKPRADEGNTRAIALSGAVKLPGEIWLKDLRTPPPVTVSISQQTGEGPIRATFKGILLWTIIDSAGWVNGPEKNAQQRHTIMVTASDGYAAALSEGEIDPKLEGKQVILAYEKDGAPLAAPQLVVPGDAHASRGVHDVAIIEVK